MKIRAICVLLLAALAAPLLLWAQARAAIAGSVRIREGNSGQPVLVQLHSEFGGVVARVTASSSGRFEFFNVPSGRYDLVVEMAGFKPYRMRVEYVMGPVEGLLVDLVPEGRESDLGPGAAVPLRVLQAPPKARQEYERGLESISRKRFEEGAQHFRKAIESFPDFDEAYLQLGLVHLQQNRAEQAQSAFENVTRIHPQSERGFMLLGRACRLQKKLEEAVAALSQSIQLKEDSWFAQLELGEALLELGRLEEAATHVARAHALNAREASIHQLYYNTLIRQERHREALAELEEFLQLFPGHALAPRARQQREALSKFLVEQGKP